jgi:3-phenylpropionate/cinnamic acid dioxygenase small subunit
MASTVKVTVKSREAARPEPALDELQGFVENEARLLDGQRFEEWLDLFADDGVYWVPAKTEQQSPLSHVSLFYDNKPTLKVRIQRLRHPAMHSQIPKSQTVRLVANFRRERFDADPSLCLVRSKFIMFEDRPGHERRLFGGQYSHTLRRKAAGFEIVLKRVDLTNCDQTFSALTQPF